MAARHAHCLARRVARAIFAAALFEVGKFLIGLYIGKQNLESTYGAAASSRSAQKGERWAEFNSAPVQRPLRPPR
jgi:hypothetical protein